MGCQPHTGETNMNTNAQENGAVAAGAEAAKKQPAVGARILTNADGKPYAVRMTFGGDESRAIEVSLHKLTDEIATMAALHGIKQKLGDAAAISRNPETGKSASLEDKRTAVEEVANRLLEGEWNKRREGGGATGGLLLRAMVRMYAGRMTEEQVKAWLDGKTDKEKAALRKNPKIMSIIEEIRAEDGASGSGEDLLAELDMLGAADEGADAAEPSADPAP